MGESKTNGARLTTAAADAHDAYRPAGWSFARTPAKFWAGAAVAFFVLIVVSGLLLMPKVDQLRLLYATPDDGFDRSGWDNLAQSTEANVQADKKSLSSLSSRQLSKYDVIYLDIGLHGSEALKQAQPRLESFVRQGGHLFLENDFAADFPADFLGASQIVDVPGEAAPQFGYPQTGANSEGLQQAFRLFSDSFLKHAGMDSIPGFRWGSGLVPTTAQPLVTLHDLALVAVNRVGQGTVTLASTFLPNRYFITGFDLQSGMDPSQGFKQLAEQHDSKHKAPTPHAAYFDLSQTPLEPYFDFSFAAANAVFRTEYLSFVSKEKFGYSVKKIFGPYGRPAMAYQNHFEALPAIGHKDGIQWAEMLKKYNQIPSFSLVRSSYDWGLWKESVVVQLNTGTTDKPHFAGELANSFYSSGTHLASGGAALSLAAYPQYKSLADPIELPYRAYPAIADIDGDGKADLLAGSADGVVYVFRGVGAPTKAPAWQQLPAGVTQPPDGFAAAAPLLLADGQPLSAGAYAAVALADVTGDGRPDLLLGGGDGTLRLAAGTDGGFAAPTALTDADGAPLAVPANAAPAVGDIDGDGVPDLVVGDADGRVHLFRGLPQTGGNAGAVTFTPGRVLLQLAATYAAPSVKDMNGDGKADLVIGNNEGDLLVYLQEGDHWKLNGPLEGDSFNQLGNKALVGGHNSVPLWYDINHDGKDDLLVGQLEFGMPVTIDDPGFPYKQQLQEFIDYSRDNHLQLYPHLFFHNYVNDAQEKQEIALHKAAFAKLGIPWGGTGTNQHTWRINNPGRLQTLRNENAEDLWFNFGFAPSYAPETPNWGEQYLWGLPFQLDDDKLTHPMLLYTPAPYLRLTGQYATTDIYRAFTALDMPIDYFEHIEYHFPDKVGDLQEFVEYFDKLRTDEDYNFMTEQQMAQSFLTALNSRVTVSQSWGTYLWNKLKDFVGKGMHFSRDIQTKLNKVPEEAQEYARALGVVIEPGERLGQNPLRSTSAVYTLKGQNLYTGVYRSTTVSIDWSREPMHLVRANVPVKVVKTEEAWTISLNAAGMQQIKLYSPEPLTFEGDGLKVARDEAKHTYTITRYGDKASIRVIPEP